MNLLRDKIRSCTKCPLASSIVIRPVPGQGRSTARIMLIKEKISYSEAKMEDNLLVLQSTFIKRFFKEIDVREEDLYITSIVKCNCEAVKAKYIDSCVDWLKEEIFILKPKIIVCFGDGTYKYFKKHIPMCQCIKLPAIDTLMNRGHVTKNLKEIAELINTLRDNELLYR